MAPMRQTDLLPPASAATSDDETEDYSSGDEEEEEEEPHQHPQSQHSQDGENSKKTSESESESDSDEPQNSPSLTVEPVVSKSPEPHKPTSKRRAAETEQINKVSKNKKSKISNGDGQSVKKTDKGSKGSKIVNEDEESGETEVKSMVNRLWSEKDEILLLDGIIDYKLKTGDDPNVDMSAFHLYVKDFFSVFVTKTQLTEKIKRLKNKFQTNVRKGQTDEFSRPHEHKLFELSHKIWGDGGSVSERNLSKVKSSKNDDKDKSSKNDDKDKSSKNDDKVKSSKKDDKVKSSKKDVSKVKSSKKDESSKKDDNVVGNMPLKSVGNRKNVLQEEENDTILEGNEEETQDFWSLYPRLCASLENEASTYLTMSKDRKEFVNEKITVLGKEKARELEEGWNDFYAMEYQLYAKRVQMISKQTEAVAHVMEH